MSQNISVDDEVFEVLKRNAEPFVDTPNTVLRRLLGLGEEGLSSPVVEFEQTLPAAATGGGNFGSQDSVRRRRSGTRKARAPRAKTGTILPESEYEVPMLEIIAEHGGRAAAREVLDELETRLNGRLTEVDRQQLASGNIRWRNRAQFVRLRLIEQGDMVRDSPRGMWEITEQGRRRIADAA